MKNTTQLLKSARAVRRSISKTLFNKQLEQAQNRLIAALHPHFKSTVDEAVREFNRMADWMLPSDLHAVNISAKIADPVKWKTELIDKSFPVLAKSMSEAAISYFLSMGINVRRKSFVRGCSKSTASDWLDNQDDVDLPPGIATDIPEWMKRVIADRLRDTFDQDYWLGIEETTRNDLRVFLETSISEGWGIRKIADEMASRFSHEYSKQRARLVARTECSNALNGARESSYQEMKRQLPPEVSKYITKSWISVLGNTTRDAHAGLDGTFADDSGLFNLNGVLVPWPAHWDLPPSDRCNCQCTLGTEFGSGVDLAEIEAELTGE